MTDLYRARDANVRLLYVGIAEGVRERWLGGGGHVTQAPWLRYTASVELARYATRAEAAAAETAAIRTEDPVFNRAGRHPAVAAAALVEYVGEESAKRLARQRFRGHDVSHINFDLLQRMFERRRRRAEELLDAATFPDGSSLRRESALDALLVIMDEIDHPLLKELRWVQRG